MAGSAAEKTFDALGNPVRRRILHILSDRPRAVGEIANGLPVSRPAVSRHLRILERVHLVAHDKQGNRNVFRLDGDGWRSAREFLDGFWEGSLARFKIVAENSPRRESSPGSPPRGKK
jgi:DNA-binding transcriptional ArsR family regulator